MKHLPLFALLALAVAAPSFAQQAPTEKPMPAWEQLSAADRDLLVAPVRERWNAQPGERARMLERARRWQSMTPEQRQQMRHGARRWVDMTPEQRQHMRAIFKETRPMTPEQRQALRAKLKGMTPEERKAWFQEHAIQHPAPQH